MTPYQDLRIDGRTISRGQRECASRFELIRAALPAYTRPITVLDLGAAQGYFSIRLAESYEHTCAVLIDDGPDLPSMLAANALPWTIGIRKALTEEDLEALADCEHFDVVLCLNFLHHLPDAGRALRAVLRMGEETFIEVPGPEDVAACGDSHAWLEDAVRASGAEVLGAVASHTTPSVNRRIYHRHQQKAVLQRAYMGGDPPPMRQHQILSSLSGKAWNMPEKHEARVWWPGINLQTYLTLGGVYPSRAEVAQMVERETRRALFGASDVGLTGVGHYDIRPHNFVLTGESVTLIDWADPRQDVNAAENQDETGLQHTLRIIRGENQ